MVSVISYVPLSSQDLLHWVLFFFLLLFIHIVIRRGLHECQGKAVFDFSV